MQLGIIGLGRMGGNIARRLMRKGHELVVYDRNAGVVGALANDGATGTDSLTDLIQQLTPPRAVWVMLPAGEPTEQTVTLLGEQLEQGDIVIDGGNTLYKDDIRRAEALRARGIDYVDVGISGGVWGLERGYCMMVGADKPVFDHLETLFSALVSGRGWNGRWGAMRRKTGPSAGISMRVPLGLVTRWYTTVLSTV